MTTNTEVPAGLKKLREPFPANQISKLPKATCGKDEYKQLQKGKCNECGGWHPLTKTMHLDYVGHAALTDRLLDADPAWTWEPMARDERGLPAFDKDGGLWIKLTVCGVTRLGYGNAARKEFGDPGNREKEIIGDALRNAAMRFGAALELWHKGDLHADEDDDGNEGSGQGKGSRSAGGNQQTRADAGTPPQTGSSAPARNGTHAPEPTRSESASRLGAGVAPGPMRGPLPPGVEPFDSVEYAVQAIERAKDRFALAKDGLLAQCIAASNFQGGDHDMVTAAWRKRLTAFAQPKEPTR